MQLIYRNDFPFIDISANKVFLRVNEWMPIPFVVEWGLYGAYCLWLYPANIMTAFDVIIIKLESWTYGTVNLYIATLIEFDVQSKHKINFCASINFCLLPTQGDEWIMKVLSDHWNRKSMSFRTTYSIGVPFVRELLCEAITNTETKHKKSTKSKMYHM